MSKLWEKSNYKSVNKTLERYEVGDDYKLDLELIELDIKATYAHCIMLKRVGILKKEELYKVKDELKRILQGKDKIELRIEDEDIHTKVENMLIEELGDIGKKIHTGRSRNDQVLVDIRLYSKQELLEVAKLILILSKELVKFAKEHEFVPMPGYTHMQQGMPSSVGLWASSFVESLIDELNLLKSLYELNDMSPLGSGAGYGVSIYLDRELTQKLLGFSRLQSNALYCGNSRGKLESTVLSGLSSVMLVLNKIACDILLFTTKEFDFFEIADEITTGSSIMPQKKNLDILELIRAKTSSMLSYEFAVKGIISSLPSGYNRDFQETKKYLMSGFGMLKDTLFCMILVINSIKPKEEQLISSHRRELYAADYAYKLVKEENMPFRKAYTYVGENLSKIELEDIKEVIKKRKTIGSTGNLNLSGYERTITKLEKENDIKTKQFKTTLDAIWNYE